MAKSHTLIEVEEEEELLTEMEDSDYIDIDSDDSGDDPTYIDDLSKAQSNFSNSSFNSSGRNHAEDEETDDGDVSDVDEMSVPKLGNKDLKDLEEIQKVIDCGLVEALKVEQCKVYLRKHGLRLIGKKEILIQRIKEHSGILNGGGEKKFPPSSFVLNCKGDACMGDVVMFDQIVYEGYNIASRRATGPPCGKRTVAGRIVKESYGSAKQQHTFTVEVLWSKGQNPLPPLYPLLLKGRNLYRLKTLRQRWGDESERQRVLSEKHSRGSLARSNREARIQGKISKKTLKGTRVCHKEERHLRQEKNHRHETGHASVSDSKNVGSKSQKQHTTVAKKTQQQQANKEQNLEFHVDYKENSYAELPVCQPSLLNKPNMSASDLHHGRTSRLYLAFKDQNSEYTQKLSRIGPPKLQHKFHRVLQHPRQQHYSEYGNIYAQQLQSKSCFSKNEKFATSGPCKAYLDKTQHPQHESRSANQLFLPMKTSLHYSYGELYQTETQQLCRHYLQGKCYYGNSCKFFHESNRNTLFWP